MELLVQTIVAETPTLNKNNVRLLAIGNLKSLPGKCFEQLQEAMLDTAKNNGLTLVLALSYSSKWEIIEAVKNIALAAKNGNIDIDSIVDETLDQYLTTKEIPHPELLIRTSGEHRISNFLLWQIAYAELYFTETLWPDFNRAAFFEAIVDYQTRERRFGKTSEQLIS
jgi:undecaprenyl diphosphate synthase